MKINIFILVLLMLASSPLLKAAGNHSGGHAHDSVDTNTAHWMAPVDEAAKRNPVSASKSSIKRGSQLFQKNCSDCHGKNAEGDGPTGMMLNPKPANLKAMAGTHPDGDLAYKIKVGRGTMPGWKNILDDDKVWHLVNFIQSLAKNEELKKNDSQGHSHDHKHGS